MAALALLCLLPLSKASRAEDTPRELRVACNSVGIELQLCTEEVARWSKKTGYPASVVSMPSSTSERLALYQQFLSAHNSAIDIFELDVVWPGILKTHLLPLNDRVPQEEVAQHFPAVIANNTVDGQLLAMPLYTDVGIFYYRKDLLEKYGKPAPKTWDEMTVTAQAIQAAERAEGNADFWGYVWQGRAYEGLTCNAVEWLFSQGGGTLVDDSGAITIPNDNATRAIDLAASWVGTISPKGVLNYSEEEARGVFQSGKALFMRNWPYAWSLSQGKDSPVKGLVGVSVLPGSKGHAGTGTLGGWQLAVSRYTEQPDKAVELVRYLTSAKVQKRFALEASYNPTIETLYQDKQVLAKLPAPEVLYDALQHAVARPSRVTGLRYNQVSNGFWNAVHATLSGDGNAQENFEALEHRLQRISKEGTWK